MWNMSLALAATDGHAAGTTFEELITGYRVRGLKLQQLGVSSNWGFVSWGSF